MNSDNREGRGGCSNGGGCCCSLLFHVTNLFLCGHERVQRRSGEALHASMCLLCMFQTVCSTTFARTARGPGKAWWALEKTHTRSTPNILCSASAQRLMLSARKLSRFFFCKVKRNQRTFCCGAAISRSGESKGAFSFHINTIRKEVT